MRRTFQIFVILIVATAIISCNKAGQEPITSSASPASTTSSTTHPKVVFVNIDTLLAKYDLYVEKKKELEGQSAAAEKNIAGKIDAFQKRLAKFQQEAYETQQRAASIAPIELKKLQQEFGNREQALASEESALVKQRDAAAQDLDKKLTELQNKLKDNIDTYLKKIAEERGYDYILAKGLGQSVLFGRDALDITQEAIKTMNEDYTKSNKTTK